ncbi:NAD-dependent epimerase/dehydratase family protein [Elusimicrobiota bacterium]
MKILVTGGAGFIGSHCTDRLIREGNSVVIVDNLYTGKKENVNREAGFNEVDIRDKELNNIFDDNRFDAVYHFAAQMDVRKSVEDPLFDADVNIMGGLKLLENCVRTGVKHFVFASSGGVMYGECRDNLPSEEESPYPLSPYGDSKLSFEYYLNFYRQIHGIRTVALRFGNVYGPRQDPHGEAGVVAIFSQKMLKDEEVSIFGDGEQLRDYVYVEDVVNACVLALQKGEGIYNIGTGTSESVNELFGYLKDITGYHRDAVYKPARTGELNVSRLNVSKVEKSFGWRAGVDFKEGLEKTVEYFRTKD